MSDHEPEFDCVEMKDEIQRRLRASRNDMPWQRRNEEIRKAARRDPHLARLLGDDKPKRRSA